MNDVTRESVVAVTDHFADAFVHENVARVYMTLWRHNDVRKFDADAILFGEIKRKRRDIQCLSDSNPDFLSGKDSLLSIKLLINCDFFTHKSTVPQSKAHILRRFP